jgi:nucleoside-diphosphate-sugar epimerase
MVCAGADVVFQCAQPEYHEWPEKFPPIIHGIVSGLARLNAEGNGPRLVMGDNLYMYGPTGDQPIREDLPYAATGRKGKTRANLATYALDTHRVGKVRVTIGRASDFYGPRVHGSAVGDLFFKPILAGRMANVMGNPDLPHTYTYIRDFARGLVTLSEHEAAFGRAWHVPSAKTISTRQFAELVGRETEQEARLRAAGPLMMAVVGLFSPEVREMREMMYEFTELFVVDDSDFRQAFSNGTTPHDQAIRETVAWYRTQS